MKMTDEEIGTIVDILYFSQEEKEMLERALRKVDHIDRRRKIDRNGLIGQLTVSKRIFDSAYADQKYRDFEEKIFKRLVHRFFFEDPIGKEIDELLDSMNRGEGPIMSPVKFAWKISVWKNRYLSKIVKDTVKEMKRA